MDLNTARALGLELAGKLPWQEIADSPTIRYYTDWSKFEGFKPLRDVTPQKHPPGPCEIVVINGRLAGWGVCNGVETALANDIFRQVEINSKILALHASALSEAVYVGVKSRVEPLVIKLIADLQRAHVASHLLLDVDKSASGSIVVYVESGVDTMHTAVVEGDVRGPVEYVLVSRGGGPQYVHSTLSIRSSIYGRPFVVGGVMNAVREEYILGEETYAEVVGLELGLGESRIDHVVSLVNNAPRGRSFAKLYAVAADRSFVAQRAVGRITQRGVGSESSVDGVAYIAGDEAVVNTQPVILVETGDVAGARHSAADAALDEEKEFFLRARGIKKEDISRLLIASLIDQYLSTLSDRARDFVNSVFKSVGMF
ncbi:SufBD protein [Pyrobaculum islandicum DSM 4184]|uniref:SufBD protein n=1 Tax=Pyrobaculum islandicum (strain DSM 4184 / JCM 9189 / GEO3) TaxID=384616 RepID=A1RTQ5_PYRIL|nr:SufD family Fe-S cluster assembly protein [Pyrobaculum islandicum]ABL88337.1 SufBD protein [Pyrobaculum islandicum DSM 4184]